MLALLTFLFLSSPSFAQPAPSVSPKAGQETVQEDGFQSGTHLLQEQKYDEAFAQFQNEYAAGKQFAALFYNWGLSAYKLQKLGLAVGLWRRALSADPELRRAQAALNFVSHELPRDSVSYEKSGWTSLRQNIFDRVSLNKLLAIAWIFFLTAGLLLIRYAGARKRALVTDQPLPGIPYVGYVFSLLFVVSLALSAGKAISLFETRATVTTAAASLHTGPSNDDNVIFDLIEGLEVTVKQVKDSWSQVTIASGVTGWVSTENLFQHTGKKRLW